MYKKRLLTPVGHLWNNVKEFRKVSKSTSNTSLLFAFKAPVLTSSNFYYYAVAAAEFRNTSSGSREGNHTHPICLLLEQSRTHRLGIPDVSVTGT